MILLSSKTNKSINIKQRLTLSNYLYNRLDMHKNVDDPINTPATFSPPTIQA